MPGYGQFINDNSLTLRETQFIISWVEGLGPRNGGTVFLNVLDSTAAPRQIVRAQAHFGHWQSGEPQNTRQLPPTTIEAGEADNVKRVVVDLGLKTERRIRSVEYLPGDRRVVRAAFFTVQETGQWLGSWTPWHGVTSLPKTAAYRLPAGSHVVAEIHYRGAKSRVVDQGTLGLFVADATAASLVSDLVLETKEDIPAGTPSKRLRTQVRLTRELSALALRPEIRAGVKSVEVSARKPDGGTTILLFARDFQLDWPTPYIFKDPVRLPAGTELAVTTYYANPTATPQPGGIRLTVSAIR
jgi:hypothetical protein